MSLINKLVYTLFICSSLTLSFQEKSKKNNTKKETRSYLIHKIDSTKRYFVLETTVKKDSVILVIFKESNQLKNKKLELNKTYDFDTYRFFEVLNLGPDYFHMVDETEIWTSNMKNIGLHFTDGMGNGYLESDEELEYKN